MKVKVKKNFYRYNPLFSYKNEKEKSIIKQL